jgi:hypothetical protein
MAVYVEIAVQFPDNRRPVVQQLVIRLYRESYTNKSLSKDTVTVVSGAIAIGLLCSKRRKPVVAQSSRTKCKRTLTDGVRRRTAEPAIR